MSSTSDAILALVADTPVSGITAHDVQIYGIVNKQEEMVFVHTYD